MSLVADAKASLHRALRGGSGDKFQRDVLWNFGSLGVLGVSGLALNALIALHYGVPDLGVFGLVWVVYTVFSQVAVGGIDRSVLRSVAEHAEDRQQVSALALSAVGPTLMLATLGTAAFWLTRDPLTEAFFSDSPGVAIGIAWATPGLFCFALNKVMIAVTNGLRRMRAFAIFQALRVVLMLAGLFVAIGTDMPGEQLGFIFSFAEGLLCIVLLIEVARLLVWPAGVAWLAMSLAHLRFGVRSMASGVILELNAKVDLFMVGTFLGAAQAGIYQYAAALAEGVFQLLVVLQNNYNPLLSKLIAGRRFEELRILTQKGKRTAFMLMCAVCTLTVCAYPLYVMLAPGRPELWQSWLPFGILMAGVALSSGYAPFHHMLLMANRPGWHTFLMLCIIAFNAGFNLLLIPRFGIAGAAGGTALAFISSVFLLRGLVRVRVGVRL